MHRSLCWWTREEVTSRCQILGPVSWTITTSDASMKGLGSNMLSIQSSGEMGFSHCRSHIQHLEISGIFSSTNYVDSLDQELGSTALDGQQGRSLIIQRQGGTHSSFLLRGVESNTGNIPTCSSEYRGIQVVLEFSRQQQMVSASSHLQSDCRFLGPFSDRSICFSNQYEANKVYLMLSPSPGEGNRCSPMPLEWQSGLCLPSLAAYLEIPHKTCERDCQS